MTTLTKEQFKDFSLGRKSAQSLENDFIVSYVDASEDYTLRTVSAKNSASIKQEGTTRQKSFDFTAFQDLTTVYKQLYKAVKSNSFPKAAVSFKVSRYIGNSINVGDIITIDNDDFAINADFRIVKKTDSTIDTNEIEFNAEQYTALLFDTTYINSGGTAWTPPDTSLPPLQKIKIVELPYTDLYKYSTTYAILVARETGYESGYQVYISNDGNDYSYLQTLYSYSQFGTLSSDYPITNAIDDTIGLTYTPYNTDITWNSVSRTDLFSVSRYALVGDEILGFGNYDPSGVSDIKLSGILRGVGYSEITSHSQGDEIWVANTFVNNIISLTKSSTFYIKLVPISSQTVGSLADALAIEVTPEFIAKKPYKPARIEATRNGDLITVKVYPVLKEYNGAGKLSETAYMDIDPFSYTGIIQYSLDNINWVSIDNNYTFTITSADEITIYANQVEYSFISDAISVTVGTDDGIYIGR